MSHIHFASNETYRKRIIQMGEVPERVFCFGDPGVENIRKLELLSRKELEKSLDMKFANPLFLLTYHPVTLEGLPQKPFEELLAALDEFPQASIIFTYPNSDTHGRIIIDMINDYVKQRPSAKAFISLGQQRYLSAIKECSAVIGNSSSGLVEVPALGKPTVNIGNRQKGRMKASSVIDCEEQKDDIVKAIKQALSPDFISNAKKTELLYGHGETSKHIKNILKTCDISNLLKKQFYEVKIQ